jgi:hypothetical protein
VIDQKVEHHCSNCAIILSGVPEYEHSEWFVRCSACGAKNLLEVKLTIIGCRRLQGPSLQGSIGSQYQAGQSLER